MKGGHTYQLFRVPTDQQGSGLNRGGANKYYCVSLGDLVRVQEEGEEREGEEVEKREERGRRGRRGEEGGGGGGGGGGGEEGRGGGGGGGREGGREEERGSVAYIMLHHLPLRKVATN